MSFILPNGALIAMAASYQAPLAVSAASNASGSVLTNAISTYAVGDIVEVTSGWSKLTNKIARLAAATTTSSTLENIDTTSVVNYPIGSGIGSVRKILTWTQLSQIVNVATSGGDQQFLNYQTLEADSIRQLPSVKNPLVFTLQLADDPSLASYQLCATANDDKLPRAISIIMPNGTKRYYNAYISLNRTPSMTLNQMMTVPVTFNILADPVWYAT